MQPAVPIKEGSPTKKPCGHIVSNGTANEQSASGNINSADEAGMSIHAAPVPLYLVPATISAEIHANGGDVREITVRRTRQHVYAITLTRTGSQGKDETADTASGAGDADAA